MKFLALFAVLAALAGCGGGSPYSHSADGDDTPQAVAGPAPACTTVTTTTGYLIYRC
jgi:hypothetical protein